jgi:uncharacterized protein (TIGR00269 family)
MAPVHCCNNSTFTSDARSKNLYCKQHFTELIENRVKKVINQYNMLEQNDHIGFGYSGGKDSTVLLYILYKLNKRFPNCTITAITIDEGIDGYRNESIEITRNFSEKYNIPQVTISFDDIYGASLDEIMKRKKEKKITLSACAICGILRRRAINFAARKINATKIATAHNLDDEAQSILMNVLRGDSAKFIRLIRNPIKKYPMLIPRIRPFVQTSEPEIVLYAFANNLEYHSYPCPYSSSAMRNDIRSFLSEMEEKRPSTLVNIVKMHDSLMEYFPHSSNLDPPYFCKKCNEISTREICPVCHLLETLEIKYPNE